MLTRNAFTILDRSASGPARDQVALSFGDDHRTFAQIRDRALRLANGLGAAGVRPGDRVAVLLANGHEWPEVFFGLAAMGAICVPVNVLLTPAETQHVCADSGARCLILDGRGESALAEVEIDVDLVVTIGELELPAGRRGVAYEDLMAAPPLDPGAGPDLDDLATLYYSSGTTGLPKAAAHTHANILWNCYHQVPDLRLTRDDVYLLVPSMSWAAGIHNVMLALIWMAGRTAILPTGGASPERLVAAIDAAHATHAMLVPTLLRQFLADPAALEGLRRSSLRWIVSGAEPVPRPVIEQIAAELPDCQVVQGYGLSEFPTIATILMPEEAIARAGTAGRPCSHTDLAIEGDDGVVRRDGEGEILLRSLATMRGYFERPEETEAAFRGGWLHTGDVGRVDDDGFLTITGRKKDMIISGGLNIYPKEVEEVLYRVPGVQEASVVGVPDETWGETAVAILVADAVDTELVTLTCKEQLASYKRPRHVIVRDSPLPRTPTGKVLKRELRPWAASQLGMAGEQSRGGR